MARKVHVPQDGGEITISRDGGEPRTWRPQGHLVTVRNDDEHDLLIGNVPGARAATARDEPDYVPPREQPARSRSARTAETTGTPEPGPDAAAPSPQHDPQPEPAGDTPS